MLLSILYIIQVITIIKNYYFNILFKHKFVVLGILLQIACNILNILIIISLLSFTFIFLIPLTSRSIKEFLFKLIKLLFLLTCCYFIKKFYILRYIILLMFFIWNLRQQLAQSYSEYYYYFTNHKIIGCLHLINEIIFEYILQLSRYLKQSKIILKKRLIKIPLYYTFFFN